MTLSLWSPTPHAETGAYQRGLDAGRKECESLRAELAEIRACSGYSHAWKSGYAQAQEEHRLEVTFCPHCNPCRHAGVKAELAEARALLSRASITVAVTKGNLGEHTEGRKMLDGLVKEIDAALAKDVK